MRLLLVLLLATACLAGANDEINAGVSEIAMDVAESRIHLSNAGQFWYDGHLSALSAMHWTAGRLSAWRYLYRKRADLPLPVGFSGTDVAIKSVEMRAGLCAGSAFVMMELLSRTGYQVRKVDAWYPYPAGHALVEVWYGGAWHCYDPTFARYWVAPGGHWSTPASAAAVAAGRAGDAWEIGTRAHIYELVDRAIGTYDSWGGTWWDKAPLSVQTGSTVLYSR